MNISDTEGQLLSAAKPPNIDHHIDSHSECEIQKLYFLLLTVRLLWWSNFQKLDTYLAVQGSYKPLEFALFQYEGGFLIF